MLKMMQASPNGLGWKTASHSSIYSDYGWESSQSKNGRYGIEYNKK